MNVLVTLANQLGDLATAAEKSAARIVNAQRTASQGGDLSSSGGSTSGNTSGMTSGAAAGNELGALLSGVPNGPSAGSGRY